MLNVQQNDRLHVLRSLCGFSCGFFFSSFLAYFVLFFCSFFAVLFVVFCGVCLCLFVIFPVQTGTATSSPLDKTASQFNMNIVNTMLWMKRNAYQESTIAKVAKLLRHLKRNCNTAKPEEVKLYVSKKNCSDAHKENLVEAYACYMKSINQEWEQPFYRRYSKKRKTAKLVRHMLQERF